MKHLTKPFSFFLISLSIIFGQSTPDSLNFNKMDKTICRIYIHQNIAEDEVINMGTGIIVSQRIDTSNVHFIFTANHVVENLIKLKKSYMQVFFSDLDNNIYYTDSLNMEHIIWHNEALDAAILGLPNAILHKTFPVGYIPPGIEKLKLIGTGKVGEEVFMLGKRWLRKDYSISILKRGIISSYTNQFPDFKNYYVYLIDKMSNKGMSGGLIYNSLGEGIALVSGYVVENDKKIRTSDDLTIGIPLIVLFGELENSIDEKGNEIKVLLGY